MPKSKKAIQFPTQKEPGSVITEVKLTSRCSGFLLCKMASRARRARDMRRLGRVGGANFKKELTLRLA